YMDSLKEEIQQGITIDVAYRYFSTPKRKFIIADTPGHVQYTRNMATGASTADLAVILVDAREGHGVMEQTKRHSFIASLLGIKHVILAVNKMDCVDYSEVRFNEIIDDYRKFVQRLEIPDLHFVPISALKGDNVVDRSDNMTWYQGSTLMNLLETVEISSDRNLKDFRFPVQIVLRPDLNFRGFAGTISSGIVRVGDEIITLPSRKSSKVKEIVTYDGKLNEACAPMSITLTLEDEIDISRGDIIVRPGNVPKQEDKFDAMLVWMSESPMVPGQQYLIKHTTRTIPGTISTLRYQIDVNTMKSNPSPTLELNQIGRVDIRLDRAISFDRYRRNKQTGAFIVIDRITNVTVAAGMILDQRTSDDRNDAWDTPSSRTLEQEISNVTSDERIARYGQKPVTILLTGLPGSGKTTTAYGLERRLFDMGRSATVLDGQNIRAGLSRDLRFTSEDRSENVRRATEVARLMSKTGLICILALVAPEEEVRLRAAEAVGKDFLVVHLSAPPELCAQRNQSGETEDPELKSTVVYELPQNADLILDTQHLSPNACIEQVVQLITDRGYLA
ncbi:MAG: bifunctional sulfate adenylyltransferase subunit 1/adenylylsulfate kinase, partial [Planctomycetota bacterium]